MGYCRVSDPVQILIKLLVAFTLCLSAVCFGLSPCISACKLNIPQSQLRLQWDLCISYPAPLSLPLSLPSSLISDTLLDVSGLWFQYSPRFPILSSALPRSDRTRGKRPDGLNRTQDGDDRIVNNQENPTVTVCASVCVLPPQDCVLGGVPAGEQGGTSFAFLPGVLPRLAEVSLSQLQPR